ncbi:hypothetical protein HR060_10655 [Catenovulum sp. SM1970]|uniref:carbohydrate-binding protein n=1 Tax=Marinifaba aquimaris TaxID=2741323 RepID=UPI00157263D2|nr:carbohydrate-binding protein [Marinifaba aquimaris]NTS77324.1 hypothetical protein [Marinifaba aquimaris]
MQLIKKITTSICLMGLAISPLVSADDLKENIQGYMNTWIIEKADERLEAITEHTADEMVYTDPTTFEAKVNVKGHQSLNDWIGIFHDDMKSFGLWPLEVHLDSNIDIQGTEGEKRMFRFDWRITAFDGAVLIANGIDFGTANAEGKVTSIHGFFGDLVPICQANTWSDEATYTANDLVSYKGFTWRAKWWTKQEPGMETASVQEWEQLTACTNNP